MIWCCENGNFGAGSWILRFKSRHCVNIGWHCVNIGALEWDFCAKKMIGTTRTFVAMNKFGPARTALISGRSRFYCGANGFNFRKNGFNFWEVAFSANKVVFPWQKVCENLTFWGIFRKWLMFSGLRNLARMGYFGALFSSFSSVRFSAIVKAALVVLTKTITITKTFIFRTRITRIYTDIFIKN